MTFKVGDIVIALRDLDPAGADVSQGTYGVIIAEPGFYGPGHTGHTVQWLQTDKNKVCDVFEGDVKKVEIQKP